jgi:hypothetical protein
MKTYLYTSLLFLLLLVITGPAQATDSLYHPKRINKCIELLEQGQPVYYIDS